MEESAVETVKIDDTLCFDYRHADDGSSTYLTLRSSFASMPRSLTSTPASSIAALVDALHHGPFRFKFYRWDPETSAFDTSSGRGKCVVRVCANMNEPVPIAKRISCVAWSQEIRAYRNARTRMRKVHIFYDIIDEHYYAVNVDENTYVRSATMAFSDLDTCGTHTAVRGAQGRLCNGEHCLVRVRGSIQKAIQMQQGWMCGQYRARQSLPM